MTEARQVGSIYGNATSTSFGLAVTDPALRRLDYVEVEQEGERVLGQVSEVQRRSGLSFEQALAGDAEDLDDHLSAHVDVIGFVDNRGRVQTPRNPFRAGMAVHAADDVLVTSVLGLESRGAGAYLGHVKGSRIPVRLGLNVLAQKHVSVLAKTGAGKSYTVGVVLEEFLKAEVPLVILDPHGEYGSLRNANIEEQEVEAMMRFGVRPRSFQKHIHEFAVDTQLNPEAKRLRLEGLNLEGHEVADLLGGKLSGGQMGVLHQAIKDLKEANPAYTLRDIMDMVQQNRSAAKWNVINALEALDAKGIFDVRGTPVEELVRPGQCTIVNLKGVSPDVQEIVVTRLGNLLWSARKRAEVPPHILVVEEAHNFCPERGIGNAVSGAVLRTVASEGRKFGMGLVIVSQRPAKIDKNVLSQCNTQIVLKVTNPNDLKAIVQSLEGITTASADEVQRLPVGVALVAGGGLTQPVFVDVRPRHTRHGGRSIEVVQEDVDEPPAAPAPEEDVFVVPPEPVRRPPPKKARKGAPGPGGAPPGERPEPVPPAASPSGGRPSPGKTTAPPGKASAPPEKSPSDASPAPARTTAPGAAGAAQETAPSSSRESTPPVPKAWSKADQARIVRVARRVGVVGPDTAPEAALKTLRRLAEQNDRDPQERLLLYREIGEHVCDEKAPHCVSCPLKGACQFHKRARSERHKRRSPIRRLWRS